VTTVSRRTDRANEADDEELLGGVLPLDLALGHELVHELGVALSEQIGALCATHNPSGPHRVSAATERTRRGWEAHRERAIAADDHQLGDSVVDERTDSLLHSLPLSELVASGSTDHCASLRSHTHTRTEGG
jgi:hypothetical protein